jgi:hypothetical protein
MKAEGGLLPGVPLRRRDRQRRLGGISEVSDPGVSSGWNGLFGVCPCGCTASGRRFRSGPAGAVPLAEDERRGTRTLVLGLIVGLLLPATSLICVWRASFLACSHIWARRPPGCAYRSNAEQ